MQSRVATKLSVDRLRISPGVDSKSERVETEKRRREIESLGRQLLDAVLDVRRYPLWNEKKKSATLSDIKRLLLAGADANAKDSRGRTCLHYVATPRRSDDGAPYEEMVDLLLSSGAFPDIVDLDGNTPVLLASSSDHPKMPMIIEKLIQAGVDVNRKNSRGWTSLHNAAYHGRTENVRILLFSWALANSSDVEGITPLHSLMSNENISQSQRINIARQLIAARADVDATDSQGDTSLHYVIRAKSVDKTDRGATIKFLISQGASLTVVNKKGYNALLSAAKVNNTHLAGVLLETGADVNFVEKEAPDGQSTRPMTALHVAVENSYIPMVEFLLEHGADPDLKNGKGETVLFLAANSKFFRHLLVMEALLSHGPDLYADVPGTHKSLFESLVCQRKSREMQVLLENGLDLSKYNPQSPDGFSPLHQTIGNSYSDTSMLSLLLKFNIRRSLNLEHVERSGCTPLIKALLLPSPDCVKLLLDAGADVNHIRSASTPLEYAVSRELNRSSFHKLECIRLLVKAGAKLRNVLIQILLEYVPQNFIRGNDGEMIVPTIDDERDGNAIHRLKIAKLIVKDRVLYESQNPSIDKPVEQEDMGGSAKLQSYCDACWAEINLIKNNFIYNAISSYDVLTADKDFYKRVRNDQVYDLSTRNNLYSFSSIYSMDMYTRFKDLIEKHDIWERAVKELGQYLFSLTVMPEMFDLDAYYLIILNILNRLQHKDVYSLAEIGEDPRKLGRVVLN